MENELASGLYQVEVTASLAYMDERYLIQICGYNANNGRFYINKGSAGHKSVRPKSVRVIKKIN